MKISDMGSSVFLIALGGFIAWQAEKLSLGGISAPGPGFFPFYLSLLLILLGIAIFVQGVREKPEQQEAAPRKMRLAVTLIAIFIYPFLLEWLGYLLTTFLLMLLIIRMMLKKAWWFAPAVACVISAFSYLIFKVWLQVLLPAGLLGF
jgi:putative tricarboxylic transport membrane protein